MKDSDWIILDKLYEMPNITKVANLLYITQPSLTKRLQSIEDEFEIKIVNRTNKGLEFTKEGEFLVQKAKKQISFMNNLKKELEQLKNSQREIVNIGAAYTYSQYVLTEILYEYSQKESSIRFEIENEQSNILFRKVCDGEVDVAFIRGDYDGPVVQGKIDEYKGYILTDKAINLDDLPSMDRIEYKTNDKSQALIDDWWKANYNEEISKGNSVGYVDNAWKLVAKGLGYVCCFLPDNYENNYNLIMTPMLNEDGTPLVRNTWFVYKENKYMSKKLKKFIKYIEDNIVVEM